MVTGGFRERNMIGNEITVASYGGGTNSTAMLIGCVERGIPVDLILFADTGGERPHTYTFVSLFSTWLQEHGMPGIVTVKKVTRDGGILTLEDNCLQQRMLPSIAYGYKACSGKYKIQPQDKYCNNWPPAHGLWKGGGRVTKLIGYDADEPQRAHIKGDDKYDYHYPLIEWDWGRDECIEAIKRVGLPLPGKSSCFFCPNMKKHEIREMAVQYPELAERALRMERNAELTSIKGLGRTFSWDGLLATGDMFADEYDFAPEMPCGCYDG